MDPITTFLLSGGFVFFAPAAQTAGAGVLDTGSLNMGGAVSTGGAMNTGAVVDTGGAVNTRGAVDTALNTGGAVGTGGAENTGGAVDTGVLRMSAGELQLICASVFTTAATGVSLAFDEAVPLPVTVDLSNR